MLASLGVTARSSEAVEQQVIQEAEQQGNVAPADAPTTELTDAQKLASKLDALNDEIETLQVVLNSLNEQRVESLFEEEAPGDVPDRGLEVAVISERLAELQVSWSQVMAALAAAPPVQESQAQQPPGKAKAAKVGRRPLCGAHAAAGAFG